jgi:hypothetical protein
VAAVWLERQALPLDRRVEEQGQSDEALRGRAVVLRGLAGVWATAWWCSPLGTTPSPVS